MTDRVSYRKKAFILDNLDMQLKMMATDFPFITSKSITTNYGVFPVGEHEGKPTRSDTAGRALNQYVKTNQTRLISQCPLKSLCTSCLYVFRDCSFKY